MKRLLLLMDGVAEDPLDGLGDRTPLEAAVIPTFDELAREGTVIWSAPSPEELRPHPEVACLSLLGYDPLLTWTGRGAFAALGYGLTLPPRAVALLCHFASTDGETLLEPIVDDLSDQDWRQLVELVKSEIIKSPLTFVPLDHGYGLLLWEDGNPQINNKVPPDEAVGDLVAAHLPTGEGEGILQRLIFDSFELLDDHEINERRRDEGQAPANLLWMFEPGLAPRIPSLRVMAGMIRGDCLSDHLPVRGACRAAGLRLNRAPESQLDRVVECYELLLAKTSDLLLATDLLVVHLRAPDMAAHRLDVDLKIYCLERFDEIVLKPLLDRLGQFEDARMLVACTQRTSSQTGKHASGAVPLVMFPSTGKRFSSDEFHELAACEEGLHVDRGFEVAKMFLDIDVPIGWGV